jgi:hypothetical protein
MQWSAFVLDTLLAPKLSELTRCGAPELPDFPNYRFSLILNQLFSGIQYRDYTRILLNGFIGRLAEATKEYQAARICLDRYVSRLPEHDRLGEYWKSLMHFEVVVLRLHLAITCLGGAVQSVGIDSPIFKRGDTSDYDRLRLINNRIKHFDEDIQEALSKKRAVPITPLWITNDGIESSEAKLTFLELVEILKTQTEDARNFSETFFNDARDRRKESGLGTSIE